MRIRLLIKSPAATSRVARRAHTNLGRARSRPISPSFCFAQSRALFLGQSCWSLLFRLRHVPAEGELGQKRCWSIGKNVGWFLVQRDADIDLGRRIQCYSQSPRLGGASRGEDRAPPSPANRPCAPPP